MAGLVAFLFVVGSEQDEGHAVNGVLVFSGGGFAVIFERLITGSFGALAGLMGEAEQIEGFGVALLGERRGEFDGLGVAAVLEGIHRGLCGALGFGEDGGGIFSRQ